MQTHKAILLTAVMYLFVQQGCSPPAVVREQPTPLQPAAEEPVAGRTGSSQDQAEDHQHKPSAHGGMVVSIGLDSYHAEVIVEKSGGLRLLILGRDESRIHEVDIQSVRAYVRSTGDVDATAIDLVASPQEGDSPGKTSQFIGQLPESALGKTVDVTIPNLNIGGDRFRVGFTTAVQSNLPSDHGAPMPTAASSQEDQQLYLTPGGKYTRSDIEANGRMTAGEKFKGLKANHDALPQKGDRLCPISMTKANSKFTWIIDSQPYEFCCPPCVDEFLKRAKEKPDQIKAPDAYIK